MAVNLDEYSKVHLLNTFQQDPSLSPTDIHVASLYGLLMNNLNRFINMTPRMWWESPLVRTILFSGRDQYISGMKIRAKEIVQHALQNNSIQIIYLDGHGRFTWLLIGYLLKYEKRYGSERINTLLNNLIVCDISDSADKWHRRFFPKCVYNVHGDVFEYLQGVNLNHTTLYLNFCGLGKSRYEFENFVRENTGYCFYVSFGKRSCNMTKRRRGVSMSSVDEILKKYGMIVTSKRSFITWKVNIVTHEIDSDDESVDDEPVRKRQKPLIIDLT